MDPPDPQHEDTFNRSKLQWNLRHSGKHNIILQWHKKLIELRKSLPALKNFDKKDVRTNIPSPGLLVLHRKSETEEQQLLCIFNFGNSVVEYIFPTMVHKYNKILDSSAIQWTEKIHTSSKPHPQEMVAGNKILLQPCAVTVYEFIV